MENINLQFEIINRSHLKGLRDLYKVVFNRVVEESYFEVKFGLNIPAVTKYAVVAIRGGEIVGFFGGIQQKLTKGMHTLDVIHTCDYILKKEYRGKGIFEQLYKEMKKKGRLNNVDYLYAAQSEQTFKVSKKLGWSETTGFSRFHIPILPISIYGFLKKINCGDYLQKRFEKKVSPYLISTPLANLNTDEDRYTCVIDDEFLEMKKFSNHHLIQIDSCTMWLSFGHYLTVGFLKADNKDQLKSALQKLKILARKSLVKEIVFQVQSNSQESKLLDLYLERKESFKVCYLDMKNTEGEREFKIKMNFMETDMF